MDVEFKLIGDLTMRQFAYLFLFGILGYLAYLLVIGLFKWPTVVLLVMLGLGLAFVPIEERGLDEWIVNFIRAIRFPTQRVWKKEPQLPTAFVYDNIAVVRQEMITLAPTSSRRKLEEYLRLQDEHQEEDPLDIPEKEYMMKVRRAFPNVPTTQPRPSVGVMVEEPIPTPAPEVSVEEPKLQEEPKAAIPGKPEVPLEKRQVKPVGEIKPKVEAKPFVLPERFTTQKDSYGYEPITPDMHSGRKFVNFTPSQGELILPIRGERVLSTSEDIENEEDVKVKAGKLQDLLEKIKKEEGVVVSKKTAYPGVAPVAAKAPITVPDVHKEAENTVDELKKQNEDLSKEIERLQNQILRGKSMSLETSNQEQLLKRLETQKEKITSSYSELRNQVAELQKKLEQQKTTGGVRPLGVGQLQKLTDKPNVLTGVVFDDSAKFMSDMLIIVKNKRGEAVRALKTNTMGQFIVTTPLVNGTYTVEVSSANQSKLTFDIIPIEVKGEIIPPLEMVGRK